MKLPLALAALLLVAGCGGGPEPEAESQPLSQEQACTRAEQVTDTYRNALDDAASADDAKGIIQGAIGGLRDIDTDAPVGGRIDGLADALAGLLEAVEAGTPPAQLQREAAAVGTGATALAQACGRQGK